MEIREIVARRSDLGTFLVHLTRSSEDSTARQRLEAILRDWSVKAISPFGHAVSRLKSAGVSTDSQRCVCFTETPLEYLHLLIGEIEGRNCHFEPYGVATTKKLGRKAGVNPVWYLDITPGHDWLSNHVDSLVDAAIKRRGFAKSSIAQLTPFIEQMGSGKGRDASQGYRKEFWWEREWRCTSDYHLNGRFILICPEAELEHFKDFIKNKVEAMLRYAHVDPAWGLEKIIARLAGFPSEQIDIL